MALSKLGFIVTGAQLDPTTHRVELKSPQFHMKVVGVSRPEQGIAVAQELVREGIQLLELCGGFGSVWTAKILEATGNQIPIGAVAYGPEAIDALHALFRPDA